MKNFLLRYKYQATILTIVFILSLFNYKTGAFLSGWDNLQTELNPLLAIKRALFSVWQEYQSFGLLAGMAHASDLLRAVFLWIAAFFLPQNLIRYFYHFLMLFLGGWGVFELFKKLNKDNKKASFLGVLFYILNLGTIQIFFLPFEPFSTFFAFLPWGIWSFDRLTCKVERRTFKKNLILFFLINLLGTPSFYTQQLFLVYILILFSVLLGRLITNYRQNKNIKVTRYTLNVTLMFFLIFLINSFWLLPQIYFVKNSSEVVFEAKANQLATDDTYFQNKEKGILPYFLRLEGFYFDLLDKNNNSLFLSWQNHFKKFFFIQYFFAILMILGVYYSFKKRDLVFIPSFFLLVIIFLNNTWPISLLDSIWRENKLLNQIFRSPFTKFIIPYSLVYSYFLIQGLTFLNLFIKNKSIINVIRYTLYVILLIYAFPSFNGFFISPEMKVKIPNDYFEVIKYFKNEDKNKRIALLPEYTFWGWYQHKWGYNGSGFLWYGIEQPIVSRTFDVWSNISESYFWEIKQAITEENLFKFEKVLEKYQIDYLLLNLSLKPIIGTYKGIQYDQVLNLLENSQKIKLVKNTRYLRLYQVLNESQKKDFITIKTNLKNAGVKIKLTDNDEIFYRFFDYYVNQSKTPKIYFPFLDLTSTTRIKNKRWKITEDKNYFIIETETDFDLNLYTLTNFKPEYQTIIFENDNLSTFSANLNYQKEKNNFKVFFDKILIKKINQDQIITNKNCFKNTNCLSVSFPFLPQKYGYLLKIKNKNFSGRRLFFYVLDQTKKNTYLEERLKDDVEYFILPESYQYGLGYNIVFHNQSYQNLKSENKIESIEVYLLPYQNLKSLFLTSNLFYLEHDRVQNINSLQDNPNQPQKFYLASDRIKDRTFKKVDFDAKKIAYFLYQVSNLNEILKQVQDDKNPQSKEKIIYLSQSYHPGWKAYISERCNVERITCKIKNILNIFFPFLFGKEIKEHVLVNNWANGWILSEKTNLLTSNNNDNFDVIIIFWPQFLQFLGFFLLIFSFIVTLKFIKPQENYLD